MYPRTHTTPIQSRVAPLGSGKNRLTHTTPPHYCSSHQSRRHAISPTPERDRQRYLQSHAARCYSFATQLDDTSWTESYGQHEDLDVSCSYGRGSARKTVCAGLRIRRLGIRIPPSAPQTSFVRDVDDVVRDVDDFGELVAVEYRQNFSSNAGWRPSCI